MKIEIEGMHCKSCKMLIEDALDDVGIKANVNVEKGFVDLDLSGKTLSLIKKVIEDEGYKVK
jgi:copper chaperone CopZ